jgi:hypothetical protein
MDHIRLLRRAFDIVRSYRVLWIFGFLLALTTSHGTNGSNSGYRFNNNPSNGNNPFPNGFSWPSLPQNVQNGIIGLSIGLICLVLVLIVVFSIVRYVSETAAIRMVDRYETSGEKMRFREGWRLGWNRAAFRMWLVDLIFGLLTFVVVLVLFAIAAAPLLLWASHNNVAGVIGIVSAIGLGFLVILVVILIAAALSILDKFFHRAIALENLGVFDSIRRGWQIVRRRPGDVIIMGLILFGIGLVFTLLMIPVVLVVAAVAAVGGGLPALLAGGLTSLFAQGYTPWVVGLIIGIPVFLIIISLPLAFISGLMEAFTSSTWTLTYREVVALELTQPPAAETSYSPQV